jgi:hypothetical protein
MFVTNNWKHFYCQYCLISETAFRPCPSDNSCIKMKMYLEHLWNDTAKGIRSTRRRASPTATLSTKVFTWSGSSPAATIFTTDLTWSVPGWNAGLRGEGRATDPLSYGTPIKQPSSSSGFYPLRSVRKRKLLSVFQWFFGQPLIFQTPSKRLLPNTAKDVTEFFFFVYENMSDETELCLHWTN